MKDSGVAWIGDVPEGWTVERLQWHADEVVVKNDPIQTTNVLSLTNDRGVIPYSEKGNQGNKSKEDYSEYKIAYENTIIANSMNILIGSVGLSKYTGCISPVYYVFKARENTDIHFLDYLFQMRQFQRNLRRFANGILEIRLRVSASDILKRHIAFPSLPEQRAIAGYLDGACGKIDGLREKVDKQIAALEEYKKSVITEAVTGKVEVKGEGEGVGVGEGEGEGVGEGVGVGDGATFEVRERDPKTMKPSGVAWIGDVPEGWGVTKIKHLATEDDSLFIDGDWINSDIITDEGVRYLTSGNVGIGVYKRQGSGHITEDTFNELHCLKVYSGDLMICRLNEPIGRACIIPDEGEPYYVVAVDNVILRPDAQHDKRYLMYCMNTSEYAAEAFLAAAGTTMKRISRTDLGNLKLPIPPLPEQRAIAGYLDRKCAAIDGAVAKCKKQLDNLAEYKKDLIYECVTGKREVEV